MTSHDFIGVTLEKDRAIALLPSGARPTIMQGDRPAQFIPGWHPALLLPLPEGRFALLLINGGGAKAWWELDADCRFISNNLDRLRPSLEDRLVQIGQGVILDVWHNLICGQGEITDTPDLEDGLFTAIQLRETDPLLELMGGAPRQLLFSEKADRDALANLGLDGACLQKLFDMQVLPAFATAIQQAQPITFPSPFAPDQTLHSDFSLNISLASHGYVLRSSNSAQSCVVVVSLWKAEVIGIFFPAQNVIVYKSALEFSRFSPWEAHVKDGTFLHRHVIAFADAIKASAAFPMRTPVCGYTQNHLGHHLWNEISGLDYIARHVDADRMPEVALGNADESEMFGPIDAIFPQLAGKVMRFGPHERHKRTAQLYRSGKYLMRPSDDFVSAGLARQIAKIAHETPRVAKVRREAEAMLPQGTRTILLGLRFENRTLSDFQDFAIALIAFLHETLSEPVAIVFDGHNSRMDSDGKYFVSHAESAAARAPIDLERDLVAACKARFSETKNLFLIDNIGGTVEETIYWCCRSELFVTPWGAGLAKYRWVCNTPGLVLTSRSFPAVCGVREMHLYDWPQFMGNPTAVVYNSPFDSIDDTTNQQLVDLGAQSRVNFRVDRAAVFSQLAGLLSKRQVY